jgi:dTDP-4-dehydrorhamnose reductase
MAWKERNILVLGGEGMLGHKLTQVLRTRYPDTTCSIYGKLSEDIYTNNGIFKKGLVIEGLDAMNLRLVDEAVGAKKWDIVVNCIGIVKQRKEASDPIKSITVNSLLPHRLAALVSEWGGRLIHFSTDCVFNGRRGSYTEEDISNAEDLYGRTKYLGEVAQSRNALTLRTSIIGRELSNCQSLLEWFLSQRGQKVRGYARHIFSGVTTNYLARLVSDIVERAPFLWGMYQVAGRAISKYELLCLLRDNFQVNIEIVPDQSEFCDRSLVGNKFVDATGLKTPPWQDMLEELIADKTPYETWRG